MPSITRLASITLATILSTAALAVESDWSQVAQAVGKSGSEMPGGVYRVGLARSDLKVALDGVEIKPALALGSWLAFQKVGDQAMVMGDLVLTAEEVGPVMKKLMEGSIDITGLHNHLRRSSPATLYMHVRGHGNPVKLAATLHAALAESKTPFQGTAPAMAQAANQVDLDTTGLDQTLGAKGVINGGVYQFNIPRAEAITEDAIKVPVSMGTAVAINFQPTGGGKAAVTGDFVLVAKEVNPVLKELLGHGIEMTALHTICSRTSLGSFSCTSGRMMTCKSWPKVCAPLSTRSISKRARKSAGDWASGGIHEPLNSTSSSPLSVRSMSISAIFPP
jgi:hypothetical protein